MLYWLPLEGLRNDVEMDIRELGCKYLKWNELAQDLMQRRVLMLPVLTSNCITGDIFKIYCSIYVYTFTEKRF
jgi:hypothetical protein